MFNKLLDDLKSMNLKPQSFLEDYMWVESLDCELYPEYQALLSRLNEVRRRDLRDEIRKDIFKLESKLISEQKEALGNHTLVHSSKWDYPISDMDTYNLDCQDVWYFDKYDVYLAINYQLCSYGPNNNSAFEFKQVFPKQKIITYYDESK